LKVSTEGLLDGMNEGNLDGKYVGKQVEGVHVGAGVGI
jgi:hypothetical protein